MIPIVYLVEVAHKDMNGIDAAQHLTVALHGWDVLLCHCYMAGLVLSGIVLSSDPVRRWRRQTGTTSEPQELELGWNC